MRLSKWITPIIKNRLSYRILLISLLLICIVLLLYLVPSIKPNDFIEYWSASRLISSGMNPYDPAKQFETQKQTGLDIDQPTMFYLPPWVFPFIFPFSVISFPAGQLLWLLMNILIILVCTRTIWQIYGGSTKQIWLAWVVGIFFAPTYVALGLTGQISPLMLAGITGFIYFSRKPKLEWLAGVFASLLMIKPQATFLFLLVLFIWGIRQKQWRLLQGFFISLIIENCLAFTMNPAIFSQYYHLIMTGLPNEWASPAIGSVLRLLFGPQHIWLQYISLVPGVIWLMVFGVRVKKIDWRIHTPVILLISTASAVYAWTYDHVILLVPILYSIRILLTSEKRCAKCYLFFLFIINLIAWILRAFVNDFWFFWLAPTLLIWYIGVQKMKIDEVQSTTSI